MSGAPEPPRGDVGRLLRRMVARAIWRSRGAFIATTLVSAFASLLFVAAISSGLDLERSCEETYARLHFMHFLLPLADGPDSAVERVRHVAGVEAAEGRHISTVKVPIPASAPPEQAHLVKGKLHGLPVGRRPAVDDVAIDEGRYLSGTRGEVLMETRFARAHGFALGQHLRVFSYHGAPLELEIVGLASSPEFVWISRSRDDPRPTATSLALLFAAEADVRRLDDAAGCADIHVRVTDEQQATLVMAAAARSVAMWRDEPPVPRDEQASYIALRRNRQALSAIAASFPPAFALLGCVTLAAALRLLLSQRRSTGVLLALGCDARALASPWLFAAALMGGMGGLLGALFGIPLGFMLTRFYTGVLGLPFVSSHVHPVPVLVAVAVLAAVSTAACALTLRGEQRLRPADLLAGREATTPRLRLVHVSKTTAGALPLALRLPLLGLLRRPGRSALAVLGLTFAVLQLTLVGTLLASQQAILKNFFGEVNRWTFYVTLRRPVPVASLPSFDAWPGVLRAEAALRFKARVQVGARSAVIPVLGLPPHATLVAQVDADGQAIDMTESSGLFLTPSACEQLDAHTGAMARVSLADVGDGPTPPAFLHVGAPLDEPIALASRMPLRAARAVLTAASGAPSQAVDTVLIRTARDEAQAVRRRLDHCDIVHSVLDLDDERAQAERLLSLMDAYALATAAFAVALALVLAASASVVGLLERRRELALLETLGLGRADLARLLTRESGIAWAVSLLPGVALGLAAAHFALEVYRNTLVHMHLVVTPGTLVTVAALSLLLCLVAVWPCLRALRREPLREALDTP